MLWAMNGNKQIYIPGFTKNKDIVASINWICRNVKRRIYMQLISSFPESKDHKMYIETYRIGEYTVVHVKHMFADKLIDYIGGDSFLSQGKKIDFTYYRPESILEYSWKEERSRWMKDKIRYLSSKYMDWGAFGNKLKLWTIQML